MDEEEWNTDDYEWAIPQRTKSQEFLLEIYKYLQSNPTIETDATSRAVFALLVGAGFSLWRAVFLAQPQREWEGPKGIIQGAKDLLSKVLENNAILYGDEKKIEGWSVGYYLNNAYYRIDSAIQRLSDHDKVEALNKVDALSKFLHQKQRGITSDSPRVVWDIACDAAFAVLDILNRHGGPAAASKAH